MLLTWPNFINTFLDIFKYYLKARVCLSIIWNAEILRNFPLQTKILVVTEEKSQLLVNFSLSDLVYILIRPISTIPVRLVIIGENIFLAILSGVVPINNLYQHLLRQSNAILAFKAVSWTYMTDAVI